MASWIGSAVRSTSASMQSARSVMWVIVCPRMDSQYGPGQSRSDRSKPSQASALPLFGGDARCCAGQLRLVTQATSDVHSLLHALVTDLENLARALLIASMPSCDSVAHA